MRDEIYCEDCGQTLPNLGGILGLIRGAKKFKFKDGWRCEKCARAKVEKVRRKK